MKLVIAYLPLHDPNIIHKISDQVSALSFSSCYGIDSTGNQQTSTRVEKYCEDSEVDSVISAIKSAVGWTLPTSRLSEEEKQALLDSGLTEEELKPFDPVRPNGENLGKIIVLEVNSLHRVYDA
jgi:hypothetical protein